MTDLHTRILRSITCFPQPRYKLISAPQSPSTWWASYHLQSLGAGLLARPSFDPCMGSRFVGDELEPALLKAPFIVGVEKRRRSSVRAQLNEGASGQPCAGDRIKVQGGLSAEVASYKEVCVMHLNDALIMWMRSVTKVDGRGQGSVSPNGSQDTAQRNRHALNILSAGSSARASGLRVDVNC
ncbi:hypothetical protein MHYP_G00118660 [Metynnis hypsauchen]